MSDLFIKDVLVQRKDGKFTAGSVTVKNGIITGIDGENAEDLSTFRGGGRRLAAGFIDVHTHGGDGVDVNGASAEELHKIGAFFAKSGTTSWLASVLTDAKEQTLHCIGEIKKAMSGSYEGAELLGLHLEGPFLAREYKGAMPENLLKNADIALFREYQAAAAGALKYITVSPEVEGVPALISAISGEVVVGIGHSGADYEKSMECVENGATASTHTCNAMKLLHQHFPAIMGAALESDIFCEAICDGRHLHPGVVRLLIKVKGLNRVVAVTDSIMAAGLSDGNYHLGVNEITVKNGDATLSESGVRAGSTLTMGVALKNLVAFTGREVGEILPLLSANPAALLGISDKKGCISEGLDADFVLLEDNLDIAATIAGGRIVYNNTDKILQ